MEFEKAKKIAAKLLSYKPYSCDEVCRKLMQKGIERETAEKTVAEFCRAGILNDEEYAKMYIHDAAVLGLKGMFRIKQELRAKGVAESVIERALQSTDIDTESQLDGYVSLKYGDTVFESYKEIEKAKAHLARKGYSLSEINRCFKRLDIKAGVQDRGEWD